MKNFADLAVLADRGRIYKQEFYTLDSSTLAISAIYLGGEGEGKYGPHMRTFSVRRTLLSRTLQLYRFDPRCPTKE